MAHEMTATDSAVYTGSKAWHGLGLVVQDAPSPIEALRLAKLDWDVEQWPLSATDGTTRQLVDSHVLNVRTDTREALGVVTAGYKPTHNRQLAELLERLESVGGVKMESAGSIRGGRRVYFLARADSFTIGQDLTHRYLMLCTGHDGTLALHAVPTSIRVVCSNTLHMALGRDKAAWSFRHSGDVSAKLDELQAALRYFSKTGQSFEEAARALAGKTLTRAQVQDFFTDVYAATEEPIPATPTNAKERKARADAAQVLYQWCRRFDRESAMSGYAGGSAWIALNAVTGWYEHDRHYRSNPAERSDARTFARLWGAGAEAKKIATEKALALV